MNAHFCPLRAYQPRQAKRPAAQRLMKSAMTVEVVVPNCTAINEAKRVTPRPPRNCQLEPVTANMVFTRDKPAIQNSQLAPLPSTATVSAWADARAVGRGPGCEEGDSPKPPIESSSKKLLSK